MNELGIWDGECLKQRTKSPYLVKPDGYFLRDGEKGKVLVWDTGDGKAKPYDDDSVKEFALEGVYKIDGIECRPAFQVLKEHVRQYTPEWAASKSAYNILRQHSVFDFTLGSKANDAQLCLLAM